MLFNSYTFIFAFLPVAWLAYAAALRIGWPLASPVLALASLVFYGWWDVRFLPLLLGSMLVNFILGRAIEAARTRPPAARLWLIVGVVFNLGLLGVFKYTDFLLGSLAAVSGTDLPLLGLVLPIGISFFTFQQIAYLVDVRQGLSERYRLSDYAVFVTFFPQLIAGPIVHHREMMPQFAKGRTILAEDVALGLSIFIAGLFKKVVIADNLAAFASPVFAAADAGAEVSMAEAWGAALAYTFQLYFDFSGYSDMAIGLARLFGIRLPLNFLSPYKATSIIDFWRRWHITLSRFLRDYLYIPLGGNRLGPERRYVNLLATMLLGGLWHGAGWGFVLWGGLHGVYLVLNHALLAAARKSRALALLVSQRWLGWGVTFLAVVFAWVFFRATTLEGALEITHAMLGGDGLSLPAEFAARLGGLPERLGLAFEDRPAHIALGAWARTGVPFLLVAAALAFLGPNTAQIFLRGDPFYGQDAEPAPRVAALRWHPGVAQAVAVSVLFIASLLFASTISEFLYFQF